MERYRYVLLFCLGIVHWSFAQQNEEFKNAKGYFDYQRYVLNESFKKKFDQTNDNLQKIEIKKTFAEIMVKMDSIQNAAYVNVLIKVKNNEALTPKTSEPEHQNNGSEGKAMPKNEKPAEYPGGLNELRQQVAGLIFFENSNIENNSVKTEVSFVVEKNGEITHVDSTGDNPSFNRQAEIAMYLLPEKFSPALINNSPVRYRFRMPLSMKFD